MDESTLKLELLEQIDRLTEEHDAQAANHADAHRAEILSRKVPMQYRRLEPERFNSAPAASIRPYCIEDLRPTLEPLREQDRLLPLANVARLSSRCLGKDPKVSRESKLIMQELLTEHLCFNTSEAHDVSKRACHKAILVEDMLKSFEDLDLGSFTPAMKYGMTFHPSYGNRAAKPKGANAVKLSEENSSERTDAADDETLLTESLPSEPGSEANTRKASPCLGPGFVMNTSSDVHQLFRGGRMPGSEHAGASFQPEMPWGGNLIARPMVQCAPKHQPQPQVALVPTVMATELPTMMPVAALVPQGQPMFMAPPVHCAWRWGGAEI